ncbi:MAG TPA: hypothetical protein VET23_06635 [Chitinophagaceae bacterium]|nr:hypothetical protein [Chitinophagaceae bacterium]
MTVVVKVSFKEYVKLLYSLTYKKPMMKLILSVALALLIWITGYYLHLLPVPKATFFQYSTLVLITIVQPLVIFSTIRKNYKSGSLLQEEVKMEFDANQIKLRGDSFYTELTWSKMYKVQELKSWFLSIRIVYRLSLYQRNY